MPWTTDRVLAGDRNVPVRIRATCGPKQINPKSSQNSHLLEWHIATTGAVRAVSDAESHATWMTDMRGLPFVAADHMKGL